MSRKEKVLAQIDQSGFGLEIGPSYDPIAPKKEGFKVQIIDHLPSEQLIAKYEALLVPPEKVANIEEVDFVWRGETYAELTGKPKYYDWIIASHVIEHMPDLIDFLNNCDAILKDDGVIALVIPDKRYCFDHFRPISGIGKVIDSHLSRDRAPTAGAVAEYMLSKVAKDGAIVWEWFTPGELQLLHSLPEAALEMKAVIEDQKYIDVHSWCFVPHSFRLLMRDLYDLGLILLREVSFLPTDQFEFYVTLGRNGHGPQMSRLEMLETIELELKDQPPTPPPPTPVPTQSRSILQRLIRRLR